jgi:hypothetical protein
MGIFFTEATAPLWLGLATVILSSIVAPFVVRYMDMKERRIVAEEARRVATQLLETNQRQEASAQTNSGKLDVIHGLVNSDKTESLKREYSLLQEVIELKKAAGQQPLPMTMAHLAALKKELEYREEYAVIQDEQKV